MRTNAYGKYTKEKDNIQEGMVFYMSHVEKAIEYFHNNFNCSQSVFASYAKELGVDEKTALKIASNFGGGARKGELCGAVVILEQMMEEGLY